MFTGARKKKNTKKKKTKKNKKREIDWQLVASYFTVKSTDIFCSVYVVSEHNGTLGVDGRDYPGDDIYGFWHRTPLLYVYTIIYISESFY